MIEGILFKDFFSLFFWLGVQTQCLMYATPPPLRTFLKVLFICPKFFIFHLLIVVDYLFSYGEIIWKLSGHSSKKVVWICQSMIDSTAAKPIFLHHSARNLSDSEPDGKFSERKFSHYK
jgi:hypothetical protein